MRLPHAALAGALILGILHGLAFAPGPFPAWLLPLLQLATFGALSRLAWRAPTLGAAVRTGAAFGAGTFIVGISWIYISLHVYAYMAAPLAALGVGLLAAYLALYPALATGVAWWLTRGGTENPSSKPAGALASALAMAAAWTGAEWLRGVLFTGFPWLNIGYAHVDGPLHGWAPLLGVYGVAFAAAFTASALAWAIAACRRPSSLAGKAGGRRWPAWAAAVLVIAAGWAASAWTWVRPHGSPLTVRLVQADIPLSDKFDPAQIWQGMDRHRSLAAPARADGRPIALTLLPETAVPVFQDQLTEEAWQEWVDSAALGGGTFVLGVAMRDARSDRDYYYNSVIALDAASSPATLASGRLAQRYDKRHLVPFGEFVPPGFRWFVDEMVMPLGDFDRGQPRQKPFDIGGQHIAMNICYEDVFGEELLPAVRPGADDPGATILANVSNLAWFGNSLALPQHLQMSRMRVRETGRPMLRATNTGMTAAVDAQARVIGELTPQTAGALDVTVQGTTGLTPYTRTGNAPILILVAAVLAALAWARRPSRTR
ncbi:Apolipoprotein N-acyltransferase [Pigmentiphaga humi]|uniref:Apolipoprotein N-acyltransferase n=1 Tax=Pigmentiphaga humi TaxID=2478468 RepID=A0A3P4B2F2_9BURK|nr:apolipoprotein N-acyltransferase [Pigmentiphaga humi]VCU69335.1 Apolipoprotein N-acyltransferase [Pigmentiphaga humi]